MKIISFLFSIPFAGFRRFYQLPKGGCMLGQTIYPSGAHFNVDQCTRCSCKNGTVICSKETCPVLECPREVQTTSPGRCCPQCTFPEQFNPACTYGGRTYRASMNGWLFLTYNIYIHYIKFFLTLQRWFNVSMISPRQDGESWKLDPCKSCKCMQGQPRCAIHQCPPLTIPCPPNSKLEHPPDQCCPRCVESE